ncbi:MAG: hypothetical protein LAO76_11655 [Acidobacteriia bacterium]|nr:hypothetical protein [Terriglobia bacterium]
MIAHPPATAIAMDNPWPGLTYYTEQQHQLFFGREPEIAELVRMIQRETLTVLYGRSGLGKTSLLRAGVVPRLRSGVYLPVLLRLDFSDEKIAPVEQVKLETLKASSEHGVQIEQTAALPPNATLWEFFHASEFWGPRNDRVTPILMFDQFEELFTLGKGAKLAADFLEQLADLAENRVPVAVHRRIEESGERLTIQSESANCRIVLSLREDFVSKLDTLQPVLPAVMRNRFALNPLDSNRALQVIVNAGQPWVSEDVARDIVAVLAHAGERKDPDPLAEIEPAYLSVMCHELFLRMMALGKESITRDLVAHEKGEIIEALYERSLEGLGSTVRLFVEDRLLTATGFRGTVPASEAAAEGVSASDLATLVDRRLLRVEERLGTRHVELSHDLLTKVVKKSRDERLARERHAEEERKHAELKRALARSHVRTAVAVVVAIVAVAAAVFWWAAYVHPFKSYYRDFTKRFGVIKPYGRLSSEAVRHRQSSLRVVKKGFWGEILAMEAIDSTGRLTKNNNVGTYLNTGSEDEDRSPKACRWEFVYDSEGQLVYETAWDENHRMVWGFTYAPSDAAMNSARKRSDAVLVRKATFVGPGGLPMPQSKSRAEIIEFQYNNNGNEIQRRYLDRDGKPSPGPDQAFGKALEYDSSGRQTKDTSLDSNGHPMNDSAGNASFVVEYDHDGNQVTGIALDANGRETLLTQRGWSKVSFGNDRWGNLREMSFFDVNNAPVIDQKEGAHIVKFAYDNHGNTTEMRYFDVQGNAMDRVTEPSFHRMALVYDPNNRLLQSSYFDRRGQPVIGLEGGYEVRYNYDARGFMSTYAYYGPNQLPTKGVSGFHLARLKSDDEGNEVEAAFFGPDLKPTLNNDQYHSARSHYDGRGRLVDQSYYGIDGQPCLDSTDGSHKYTQSYDRFGNILVTAYFGPNDKPILSKLGYHRKESRYNQFGEPREIKYFDAAGNPVADKEGIHRVAFRYDERGLLVEETHYGKVDRPVEDDRLAENKAGIARIRYEYNAKRQRTVVEYFGVNGPKPGPVGAPRILTEYDAIGRKIRETKQDGSGHEIASVEPGTVSTRQKHDSMGRVIEESYHDEQGSLKANTEGYAIVRYELDQNGNPLITRYFGTDEKPVIRRGWSAILRKEYDKSGRVVKEAYFDLNDRPMISPEMGVASGSVQYDAKGNMIELASFDTRGEPLEALNGYARVRVVKDSAGNKLETDYYDRFSVLVLRLMANGNCIPSEASLAFLRNTGKTIIPVVAELPGDSKSIAKTVRLHIGDVLLEYDGRSYNGLEWTKQFDAGQDRMRTLLVLRNGKRLSIHVPKGQLGVRFIGCNARSVVK